MNELVPVASWVDNLVKLAGMIKLVACRDD